MQFVKTLVSRFISAPIAAATGYLVSQGIIPAETGADVEAAVVGFVALVVYGIGHKLLDGMLNPGTDNE